MSLIDIKAVEAEALKEINAEGQAQAKNALVKQLRQVEVAKKILRAEEQKLADLKQQIADGQL